MARIVEHLRVPVPSATAFDYVADFTTTADWDPMIATSERLDAGPLTVGSSFAVALTVGSRTVPLVYTITVLEPSSRVVLETRSRWFRGRDDITVSDGEGPGTTLLRWDATFALRGPLALLDPLLATGFRRVAARAVAGLERELTALGERPR
jgi:dehydrogenase/reductase SDR family member 12